MSAFENARNFFAACEAPEGWADCAPYTHSGEGGPMPPTGKSTHSDYVYAVTMGEDDKVTHMTKIWNAPWALRELGWAD